MRYIEALKNTLGSSKFGKTSFVYLFNGVVFQCTWFVCVVTENALLSILASLSSVLVYFYSLKIINSTIDIGAQLIWMLSIVLIGWVFESVLLHFGFLTVEVASQYTLFGVNIWLLCIWLSFSTTFRFCFYFLLKNPKIVPFAGLFACTSYVAGAGLSGELALGPSYWTSVVFIALFWAALLPLLCQLYKILCRADLIGPDTASRA